MRQDKILLCGMVFYGRHGYHPEEQRLGQRFIVDLEMEADLSRAGRSDRLEETVDYGAVYHAVREIMEGPPQRLLERVCTMVGETLMARFPIEAVLVRVKKPAVPIPGPLEYAGVEITLRRDNETAGRGYSGAG